jgi:hypothetical protein
VQRAGPPWSSVERVAHGVAALFLIFFSHRYQSLQNDSPEASFETVGVVRAGGTATKLTVCEAINTAFSWTARRFHLPSPTW